MKKEDIPFLNQLVEAADEARLILEKSYSNKDSENFNKAKKFIIQVHKKILETIK